MKNLPLIILLSFISAPGFAALNGKCTPGSAGTGFTGTTTYCAGAVATALTYNYAECGMGAGAASGVSCTATWYYNTTNTTTISGTTVTVSGPTVFNSAAGVNGNLPTVTPVTTTAGTYYYFCVVTWVAAGTCAGPFTTATEAITINQLPAAIGGANLVCNGSTTTLSNATAAGVWSTSNGALATIGSATGIVTGVAAGSPVIAYTLATGCKITKTITVNAIPAAITGTTTICSGLTATLADGTAGGAWSSSDITIATIGSTHILTGVSGGTATISYTLPTGCYKTTTASINQTPAVITGTNIVCSGSTTTLNNTTTSGVWSTSNGALATVGSATGIVNGVAAGSPVIAYTLPTGCKITKTITVNAVPAAITGITTICTGLTATLADGTAGGTWSSSNIAIATIGSTHILAGVSGGLATISYILPTGCYKTTAVTINQSPAAITGVNAICSGTTATLSDATLSGTWSSSNSTLIAIGSATGIITAGNAGSPIISYTTANGCKATSTITVDALPALISGNAPVCSGLTITLADGTLGGTWSSNNSAIATIGTAHIVTAISAGNATISYTLATGCMRTVIVTVNQSPAAISGSKTICVGITATLSNTFSGGVWSSSNVGLATIGSATGILTGMAAGNPTISYNMAGGCKVTAAVTVTASTAITGSVPVCVGATITLADATGGGTWSSNNTAIAIIGTAHIVTGIAAGTTTITYALGTGCIQTTIVTVNPLPATISGPSTICIGLPATLTDATASGVWSSSNTAMATIGSATGIITGVAAGSPVIAYTLAGGCKVTSAITVDPSTPITGSAPVCAGATVTLANATGGGTWSSSNTAIATIGTAHIVTGISGGTATISYILAAGCTTVTTVTVNQSPAAISGSYAVCNSLTTTLSDAITGGIWTSLNTTQVSIGSVNGFVTALNTGNPSIQYALANGCKTTIVFTVNPLPAGISGTASMCQGATTSLSDVTPGGTWANSNSLIASIGSTGIVTGIAAGTTTITYTIGTSCFQARNVTVILLPVNISGTKTICQGATTFLTDATPSTVTWTSGNTAVATIINSGLVTGVGGGTTTITYTATSGCSITTVMTVTPTSAAITGANVMCSAATTTLSDISAGGTWTSSNTGIATIGATTGIVNGVSGGTITITYNTGCGASATKVISVNLSPAAIDGYPNVCAGLTTPLFDATTAGTWSSSNTSVATVGTTGIVTGITAGTAFISYIVPSGCYATNTVAVNAAPGNVTVSGGGAFCNSATLTASNDGSGTIYFQGTTNNGTSTTRPSASQAVNTSGTYYFRAQSAAGCWSAQGSASVTGTSLPAITAPSNLCPGAFGTLSNTTPGGLWSSNNPSIVAVGSNSGAVTAVSAGTTLVTYTLGAGCNSTAIVTVNFPPTVSTGVITPILKGVTSTTLHFYTTGAPTNYSIAWGSAAQAAGFSDITNSRLDTLAQDTILHINVPSTALAAAYTGTMLVTSSGCISRGTTIRTIITDSLNIYTFAGNGINGFTGNGGAATAAKISHPSSVAADCSGNTYIADYDNGVVRKVDASGVITNFAGNGTIGYSGDGGPATAAQLSNPTGVAIDGIGNIYISDYNNMVIRKVDLSGTITTFAGNGGHGYSGDGGPATSAMLFYPVGLAVDNANNVYIADYLNSVIRMVNTSGIINTVAGNGTVGYSGDGSIATSAELAYPRSIAVDNSGSIYIADYDNEVIRKVDASGYISTIAGIGIAGYSGDGNSATLAQLNDPWGIAVDGYGDIYFSELHNNIIRKIDTSGIISTIAGNYTIGYGGDGISAIAAQLDQPMGIAINCNGNLYIADNANYAVRILGTYNRAPYFTGGATQTLNVCQGDPIASLNSLLAVNDFDTTQAETWSITSSASNGTLAISYSSSSTGNTLIPSGLTYTPAPGYTGPDAFTIQVSDGKLSSSTTINVNVADVPAPASISGSDIIPVTTTAILSDATNAGTWSSSDATIASIDVDGTVTGVAAGTAVISYSLTNACGTGAATMSVSISSGGKGRLAGNTTGVTTETTTTASLQIFPNPTRGAFNIKTSGAGDFYLFSMEGKTVGEYVVTNEQTVISIPGGLPSGIYVGRFKGTDGSTTDVKLVYEQ